jgi:hypothetical protein
MDSEISFYFDSHVTMVYGRSDLEPAPLCRALKMRYDADPVIYLFDCEHSTPDEVMLGGSWVDDPTLLLFCVHDSSPVSPHLRDHFMCCYLSPFLAPRFSDSPLFRSRCLTKADSMQSLPARPNRISQVSTSRHAIFLMFGKGVEKLSEVLARVLDVESARRVAASQCILFDIRVQLAVLTSMLYHVFHVMREH